MDTLAAGRAHHQAGRYPEAEAACLRVLQDVPEDVEAWHLLGQAVLRLNRLDEAEACYRKALGLRPDFAQGHADLGVVLAIRGRLDEAVASLRQALAHAPEPADVHNNLGLTLAQLGRLDEAEASLRRALGLNPEHPSALSTLGLILSSRGKHREMAEVFRPIARLRPDRLDAHFRLGEALVNLGQFAEATDCFQTALRLAPDMPEAHVGLGIALAGLKRHDEAIPSFRKALQLKPELPAAHKPMGDSLRALRRVEEALDAYEKAVELRPEDAEAHHARGFALDELGRYEEAIACYERAIRLKPDHVDAHNNLGVALGKLARFEEAIAAYERTVRLKPDHHDAHRNRAMSWLTLGDYARGREGFEARWRHSDVSFPTHPGPIWHGEPLEGRTILLHIGQGLEGLGDTVQFIRYAPQVRARGGRVVLESQKPLVPLMETCPGVDQVVPKGEPLPSYDLRAPLLRLMGLFTTSVDTIPAPVPYLTVDPARIERWRERLRPLSGFKVGIVWQGNPKHTRDRDRSFRLAHFEKLARIEGVRLISLQKGFGAEQVRELGGRFPVVELGDEVDPGMATILDTPAIMMGLDLVITPDTALAHLAGALGVPIWIALPFAPDWRWMLGREDSPWYPSARLFRQAELRRWGPVFDHMAAALAEEVGRR